MAIGEDLVARLAILKSGRMNFDTIWQDVKDLTNPHGGDYVEKASPGERRTEKVYDQTAVVARERFTAIMEALLTPRNQEWHNLRASDEALNEDAEVRDWFEQASGMLFKLRSSPKARFYGQMHEVYSSLGDTGNGCLFVDERPTGGTRYRYTHIGQAWIETNFEDIVDTVYYEYELTAKAAVQKWGDDAPKCARDALGDNPFEKHKYLHVVRPNENADPNSEDPREKRFEAYDVCVMDETVIGDKGGFHELPYIWTRYTVSPAEMYGRGPAMLVLPDIQMLQEMEKTFIRAGHKVADPPLLVAHDGKIGRGSKKIRLQPGGINYGGVNPDGRPMIQPLQTGARLDLTLEMMEQKRSLVREVFLNNLWEILVTDRVEMTATEVLERTKEKGQLLAPIIGRQQSELLGPLIERELNIAMRQNLLPPLPGALIEAKGEYEIEYESDATRMQETEEGAAFARLMQLIQPLVEGDPSILRKFDPDAVVEHYGEKFGVSTEVMRTDDEMEELRAAEAQAAQMEQVAQQAQPIAGAVRDLSEVAA